MCTATLGGRYWYFLCGPSLPEVHGLPHYRPHSPGSYIHLLGLARPHWKIIVTHSPEVSLGFTFADVHSMGLDKYIMASIYYYNVVQNIFTALKILCAPPAPQPTALGNHWSFYCLHNFASWVLFINLTYFWMVTVLQTLCGLTCRSGIKINCDCIIP